MHLFVKQILICILFCLNCSTGNETEEKAIVNYLKDNNYLDGRADVVFLLDRSGSVGAANFETEKGFVESFLTHVVVDANATRVAVISYSDTAERHIDYLREPKTKCFLSQDLQYVTFRDSGATNTAAALEEARQVFKNARPNVNKVLVLISDGLATKGGDPVPYANKLKKSGIQIFSFGIGIAMRTELLSLASSPQHVYNCAGFREFNKLVKMIRGDPHEASWSNQDMKPKCDHLCNSPYKGDPNDPGCCDPDARCSCALLSGMHTCVCGPGHYGLSGLAGHCKPCPIGTYKSKLEPLRSCESCPPGATTAKLASKSINDCYCREGFHGDIAKGIPCTLIKCPKLQSPSHGYLLPNCETTYGSTCVFMCEEGYELVDPSSDLRTCLSSGKWSGQTAVCRRIVCNPLPSPKFGFKDCDAGQLSVGKKCRFYCHKGFVQQGSDERECLSTKKWSGNEKKCFPIQCPLAPELTHGRHTCFSHIKPSLNDVCAYYCNEGFRLLGPKFLECRENGKLTDMNDKETKPRCQDMKDPEITCPKTITADAPKGQNKARVDWTVPQPTDNSGITPKLLTIPPNIRPPFSFPIGINQFQYVATDHAGRRATCNVTVQVTDQESPVVIKCPTRIEASTSDIAAEVFWEEPVFKDNSNTKLTIFQTATSGHRFALGSHIVVYDATDSSGNFVQCIFDVFVSRTSCPYFPPPTNGALTCNDWMYGQFCQVYCNEKYDFIEKPANWYVCDSDANWLTEPDDMPIPWPDCAKPAIPGKVRQMVKGFYYRGDCNDPRVQLYLKKVFLNHFSNQIEKAQLCVSRGACSLENVKVMCGKITGDQKRRRRDVWEHAFAEELELEFEITINANQTFNDTEAVLQDFLETIRNLDWDLDKEFEMDSTTLAPADEPSPSGTVVLTEGQTQILCKPGSVLSEDLCVLCAPGTHYDDSLKDCVDCPLGHYQENQGQLECEKCPNGTSTEYRRSRNETACKGICLPGTYSSTGLETCLACPVGTYQQYVGQTTCNTCPDGTTTASVQSMSISECQEACHPGSISQNGLFPCQSCPRGYYQSISSQTFCMECPTNLSTVDVGAKNKSECLDIDPCLDEKSCSNDGRCIRVGREAVCTCREGFEGKHCEKDINECEENPCFNHGDCFNTEGSFACNCSAGFTGALCDVEIDECLSSPCMNNATCLDKVNGYICVCPKGFQGTNCETAQEICFHDIICLNDGICLREGENDTSHCVCPAGYSGVDCSIDINDCENVTCQNNGSCVDGVASFTCVCGTGFMGDFCEYEIDECENNLCQGGSTCKDLIGTYQCICPPGWNGTFCEHKMDSNFVLMFPESTATIANMATMKLNSPLSEATVSLWVQTTDTARSGTPLSYAFAQTSSFDSEGNVVDNALTISDCSDIQIYVNNEQLVTDLQVADGRWHHLAFAWSSNSGMWALYKDGKLHSQGKNLRPNDVISGGGTMVIGQEQDTVGGGFSPIETYTGNITRVNIWNNYFSSSNVTRLCNMDDDIPGKVVAWPDFLHGLHGNIQVIKNENPLPTWF